MKKTLRILGTRGIPAAHGGFETFAEYLALFLAKRGWKVTVYCQEEGNGAIFEDEWSGVRRVRIPVKNDNTLATIIFDWKATLHSANEKGLILTLGYNTAIFSFVYRLKGLKNIINMDGIEWHRQKWGFFAKAWFYLNEWAGAWLGNHLIADHPEIKNHLSTRVSPDKITMIPYGANRVEQAEATVLDKYGVAPNGYGILIARAEPENSILEVVRAWSQKPRGLKLLVLGNYSPDHVYQRTVKEAGSDEVLFPGAIYEKEVVGTLRFFSKLYIHGHQVGGTNPSLVEALGAGNPVLAHDNRFNRWVAGEQSRYFSNEADCARILDEVLHDDAQLAKMRDASVEQYFEKFTWEHVLTDYEQIFLKWVE
jgi:glycosyltransferase involved in cell wall biosynthesis